MSVMRDSHADNHEGLHQGDDLKARLCRMRGLVSQRAVGSSFRFGVAELIAVIVPLGVAFGVIRQLKRDDPPQCLLTLLIGAGICFVTACIMVRHDRASLRVALFVALEFILIAGGFLLMIQLAAGGNR